MSAYTTSITTYVDTNYPDPTYNAAQRAQIIALGETMAALVNAAQPCKQYFIAMMTAILANPYFQFWDQTTPEWRKLLTTCEYCLNLAQIANQGPGAGSQILQGQISQAGTSAPTWLFAPVASTSRCTFAEVPVLQRTAKGVYAIQFPTLEPFLEPKKVQVVLGEPVGAQTSNIYWSIVDPKTIQIVTQLAEADPVTGVITSADEDDILDNTQVIVTITPN